MRVEQLDVKLVAEVKGRVFSNSDIPEMKYFLMIDVCEFREMVV